MTDTAVAYRTQHVPEPGERTFAQYCVLYYGYGLACGGTLLCIFLFAVPQFHRIFKDFKTSLPVLTEWTLTFSQWLVQGLWIPAILVIGLFPLLEAWLTVSVRSLSARKRLSRALTFGWILGTMFALIGLVVSLFLPLIKIIQSVSGTP